MMGVMGFRLSGILAGKRLRVAGGGRPTRVGVEGWQGTLVRLPELEGMQVRGEQVERDGPEEELQMGMRQGDRRKSA